MTPGAPVNVTDFRRKAERALPAPIFHYMEGGADDEWTLRESVAAFDRYLLEPMMLTNVESIDLKTRVLGCELAAPLLLSPTGMSRLFSHERELGVARAARRAGLLYTLSTMATTSLEDIAGECDLKMFQIYILKDRGLTREHIERSKRHGYNALCLTVDTPIAGNRERDKRNGFVMPPRFGPKTLASFAARPAWALRLLMEPAFRLANIDYRVDALGQDVLSVIDYVNGQFDRTVTWADVEWLAAEWGGPLAVKGLITAEDAYRAQSSGASAVIVSTHGGRQLDGTAAPVDRIAPIRDRVGGTLELILDGGVRRGAHIAKALALGADACSIGRPYLWGLASSGERGVSDVLRILVEELTTVMTLLGRGSVADVDDSAVSRA